jgi:vacuolar-type H+-ATPase subunit E/Vma4
LLRITANATAQAFSPEMMASLIKEIADKFTSDIDGNLSIITSVKDVAALEAALKNALAADLLNNTNVLGSTESAGGLEVSVKDGQLYFDFTVEAVTALVKEYVGPRLAQLLEGNN